MTKQRFCHSIISNTDFLLCFMVVLSTESGAGDGFFGMEKRFSAYRKNIFDLARKIFCEFNFLKFQTACCDEFDI